MKSQITSVTLNRVEVLGNSTVGVDLGSVDIRGGVGIVAGTMRDSVVGGNGQDGVLSNASQVYFAIEESSIVVNSGVGIHANSAGSNLNVTASTVGANGTGVKATAGSIVSFGNYSLNGNGSDGAFPSTISLR